MTLASLIATLRPNPDYATPVLVVDHDKDQKPICAGLKGSGAGMTRVPLATFKRALRLELIAYNPFDDRYELTEKGLL